MAGAGTFKSNQVLWLEDVYFPEFYKDKTLDGMSAQIFNAECMNKKKMTNTRKHELIKLHAEEKDLDDCMSYPFLNGWINGTCTSSAKMNDKFTTILESFVRTYGSTDNKEGEDIIAV